MQKICEGAGLLHKIFNQRVRLLRYKCDREAPIISRKRSAGTAFNENDFKGFLLKNGLCDEKAAMWACIWVNRFLRGFPRWQDAPEQALASFGMDPALYGFYRKTEVGDNRGRPASTDSRSPAVISGLSGKRPQSQRYHTRTGSQRPSAFRRAKTNQDRRPFGRN